jgi:predicted GNAT family acetyltransferase
LEIRSTFAPEEYRGKGLAVILIKKAINFTNSKNFQVIPKCRYLKDYFSKKFIKK